MTYVVRLGLTMAVVWMLLSGMFKPMLLILGCLSVALVVYFSVRMKLLTHRGQPVFLRYLEVLKYWGWLLIEIMKSNYQVTKALLDPSLPIKPVLRRVTATPDTELGRVIYANSITLTPGTTAINFTRNGDILVHALHESSLDELEDDVMARHVRMMEAAATHLEPEDESHLLQTDSGNSPASSSDTVAADPLVRKSNPD